MNKVDCPICNKAMDAAGPHRPPDFPFCSSRCKLIDLGRWLKEGYAIPSPSGLDDETMDDEEVPPKPAGPSAVRNREEA